MAYDTQEERLKVQGSEQITRDLKVNRDAYINGSLNASGDIDIQGQVIARNDVSISGDLYVNGTEHINDSETSQTSDNYLVLRHNKTTALGSNEHAGIAVHNYSPNKTATCTVDNQGTWRVADNTETSTAYTNVSYFNGVYYTGLTTTTTTVANGIKTTWDEDELDECVYYSTSYYHFDGNNWFAVGLSNNILTIGDQVTDATTITALEALTRNDLVYFRSLSVTAINEIENEPLLTRDETTNLQNKDLLTWDSTAQKAVAASRATADDQALVWKSGNYQWKGITDTVASGNSDLVTSNGVATAIDTAIGTLDVASAGGSGKYISTIEETDGKIFATEGTIDSTPTSGSGNPVSSDGVYQAMQSEIANAITSLLAKIATQFSASSVYTKDTYVSYEGNIYRCVNNHTGAWSAGDFTEVNLANDLMQIIKSMSGGGSSIDMNEIAELFNINKNPENVDALIGGGAVDLYDVYGIKLYSLAYYGMSSYIGEDLLYAENDGNYYFLIDMRNGIIYLDNKSGYLPFGKNWFAKGSYVICLKSNSNAGIEYNAGTNIKSQVYDGGRAFAYIDSSGKLFYALLLSGGASVSFLQTLSGITCNNVINAKGKFVITTNSGTYVSDGNWSTPTRVHTSASSHVCFGKNKFAMLVGGTVYFSGDALNWNATSMSGMNEMYFSCGKFVARNSSGNIYYSDDLSEWKQSPITTASGRFTDTVFMWDRAYYTRDFVNIMTLKLNNDNYGYPQSALIGDHSWEASVSGVYYQGAQLAQTQTRGSYITSYGAIISDSNSSYIKYVALKLVWACGDWLRRPLN